MRKIQMIRPEPWLISIPLERAVYCENCETVSTSAHSQCGLCGSERVIYLAAILSGPPDSSPASARYPFLPVAV